MRKLPSKEFLNNILKYNPETGVVTSLQNSKRRKIGDILGTKDSKGHFQIWVDGRLFSMHRIIWKIQTGKDPKGQIDHINGIRDDNRFINLRDVAQQENNKNIRPLKNNTSGHMGVIFHKLSNKWAAVIGVNGKRKHLGLFKEKEDAVFARKEAEKIYGFHENHGKKFDHKVLSVTTDG
jgi:hypothetical protein